MYAGLPISEQNEKAHPAADLHLLACPEGAVFEWPEEVLISLEGDHKHALRGTRFRIRRVRREE